MNNVKIRKNEIQPVLGSKIFRLDCDLTTDISGEDIDSIAWTIKANTPSKSPLIHSGNVEEGVFLIYNSPYTPILEITLPGEGSYMLSVIAMITKRELVVTPSTKLDSNGAVESSETKQSISSFTYVESNPLSIVIESPTWV